MRVHDFYRRNRLRVHEIRVGAKGPTSPGWPDSTKDYAEVDAALGTGAFNKYGWLLDDGHLVIDIDNHSGANEGAASLRRLNEEIGLDLTTETGAIVTSPSGGFHLYFRAEPGTIPRSRSIDGYPGLDIIAGKGKQVIAAGSQHDKHPGTYAFHGGDGDLKEAPEQLVRFLQAQATAPRGPELPMFGKNEVASGEGELPGREFNTSDRGVELLRHEMTAVGYTFKAREGYLEFTRPGKRSGTHGFSGHLGKRTGTGGFTLTNWSTSDGYFSAGDTVSIFHAYAVLRHAGDHKAASQELRGLGFGTEDDLPAGIDLSKLLLGFARSRAVADELPTDEEFAAAMVPEAGAIREIYDGFMRTAYIPNATYALATAIGIFQTLIGRKVVSWTGLAANDYTLILGPTASGKEGPIQYTSRLFFEAGAQDHLFPSRVASATGILDELQAEPSRLWVADEFGMILASIIGKDTKDAQAKAIATELLGLYSKSSGRHEGTAYAGRPGRHSIEAPHLSIVAVSTGWTALREIREDQAQDGLLGRICFWRIDERPKPNYTPDPDIPEAAVHTVRSWANWTPGTGNLAKISAKPIRLAATTEARERWQQHDTAIRDRSSCERAIRAALWSRTAARSMKLAMVHRMARETPEALNGFNEEPVIEIQDVNWGIAIANWAANLICDITEQTVQDTQTAEITKRVISLLTRSNGTTTIRELRRSLSKHDTASIRAACHELQATGLVTIEEVTPKSGGKTTERISLSSQGTSEQ